MTEGETRLLERMEGKVDRALDSIARLETKMDTREAHDTQAVKDHKTCREDLEGRLRVLEKFRWQITGIVAVFVAAPAWVGVYFAVVNALK